VTDRGVLSARVRASLLAGALGDAWGYAYEGRSGPLLAAFPDTPRLSDDTWLTMATCEAIVGARGRVAPELIAETFRRWFESGRFTGLGSSTLKALRDLAAGAHWATAGARGEFAAGAGAAMRIAPLAFLLDPTQSDDRVLIRDVTRVTHHSEEAYAGALAVVIAIRLCAGSHQMPSGFLGAVAQTLPDTRVRDRLLELSADGDHPDCIADRFGSSGYVVEAVPLALYIAVHEAGRGLEAVVKTAVSIGGDTDTIASIAGQIAGASGAMVPNALLERVPEIEHVVDIVNRFAALIDLASP
jgi:ADP-ribosyl-[dinitrogen reductase] hydrolase